MTINMKVLAINGLVDVLKDTEGLANIDNLVENIIWLMKEMKSK